MGKGNRNSQKRAQERIENSEMNLTRQKTQGKKSKTDKAVSIACLIFAIVIVVSLACTVLISQGVFNRGTKAMKTETVTVNASMMTFYLNEHISNWYNQNYYYIDPYYASIFGRQYSIDMSMSLRSQTLSKTDATYLDATDYIGATWYDYFMDQVSETVEQYVIYAEAANAVTEKDLSVTEEQKEEIEEYITSIKESLKESKSSISDVYGKGVKEKDIRDCYELVYLASNFVEYKREKLEEIVVADKDNTEVDKYVEDHKENFYSADCLNYSIKESRKSYVTDKAYEEAVAAAKAAAEKIAEAKSIEEFIAAIEAYEASKKNNSTTDKNESTDTETDTKTETESESGSDTEVDEESVFESKVDSYKDKFEYSSDSDTEGLDDWLFGDTPASEGEAEVFTQEGSETTKESVTINKDDLNKLEPTGSEESDTVETEEDSDSEEASDSEEETTDKINSSVTQKPDGVKVYPTFTATAYYVVRPSGIDKELTHNFGYLVCDKKEVLDQFISDFKGGEMTKERFEELVEKIKEENEASHSEEGHEHSDNEICEGNFLERQPKGAFNATYDVLNKWVEKEGLEDGTLSEVLTVVIDEKKDTKQYAVIFFEKHDFETWYSIALNGDNNTGLLGVVGEQLEDWYEAERKNNPVDINYNILGRLDVVPYYSTSDSHVH